MAGTSEAIKAELIADESMADLEANIEGYMENHEGHPPQPH